MDYIIHTFIFIYYHDVHTFILILVLLRHTSLLYVYIYLNVLYCMYVY